MSFTLDGLFVIIAIAVLIGNSAPWTMSALGVVSRYASVPLLVFLRKDMGVRTLSVSNIIIGALFLYFVGNVVGHNYHDIYRSVRATRSGALAHFTFLVFFLAWAIYRRIEASLRIRNLRPSSWGSESRLAEFLPTHWKAAPRGAFYLGVVREPLAVISIGLLFAMVLRNWFGWYLVMTGCLLFYSLLTDYYHKREDLLDGMDG